MCLAIPARVETVDEFQAEVELGGVRRTIGIALTPEVKPGDYVYVHTGYAISVVDEAEAMESLRLLQSLTDRHPVKDLFRYSS